MMVVAAWLSGFWRLCRSIWLVPAVYGVVLAATVPLAVKLHYELPVPAAPFAVESGAGPIPDYDWLDEVTANKRSLIGALAPTVIGVAAPLDNLDALLEGRAPIFALLLSAVMLVTWAWLWGGVIERFGGGSRRFFVACQQSFSNVIAISVGSVMSALLVFLVARLLLFGAVAMLTGDTTSEQTVLVLRALATALLIGAVATVTLIFDYARISAVLDDVSLRTALERGARTVRHHPAAAMSLVLLSASLFGALLSGYAAFEFIPGGSVPTVRRIIVLGEAYVMARIGVRLWNAAAQVALYERLVSRRASG